MNRRKFIGTCCCCAFASMGATLLNNRFNAFKIRSQMIKYYVIQVSLAEHCNLNCKHCGVFATVAKKEFYNLDKFKQDIKQLSHLFNKQINTIQLSGGEPLLNPKINKYIEISRKFFPKTDIDIITNATMLDKMNKDFWITLNENKIRISPSIYPIKINWESILNKAKKYNVEIYGNLSLREKLTLDNINKHRLTFFEKMALNKNGYSIENKQRGCNNVGKIKNKNIFICSHMRDGKLYPCGVIAYVRHLNKRFGTNFIVTKDDYIDLYRTKNMNEVENFLKITNRQHFPFCKYCMLNSKKVKWENVPEHDLSEWT